MKKNNEKYIALKAEMFHFDTWLSTTNTDQLKHKLERLLIDSGFNIVNFIEHNFPIKGYTAVWLLAESHLAIHTFPDQEKTYLQISSCNENKLVLLKQKIKIT
ncbi:S-adenosylmethionine decarboxylase [Tenacibaculum sp. ZS6-P6]|uniref:S-adenosylmethionine decarboxylase n=1 Tax=Tenacibaculum sp. ZS6-P6 TaxID=3447503 RepID=UPI003F968C0A